MQRRLQRGEAIALFRILTRRFGEIPPELAEKIHTLSIPQLIALIDAQIDFSSLDDLLNCLNQQS
ncbi:DUF4351 domain-containing protein [Phormidium sp. LEGE 05292]|uniref:DUF4351 domain-containing protein n=1 Tax=[Phormidium] sp. LEGE 05292 TaxID=767427 RepID=UPI00187E260E|nr:DUF4351 domain-containing protein [Phormidium sp. LEGE 05292]MBE9225281.1 DUF4351 domain-containing protein [Phormidium sp. LEGE 05292]